MLALSGGETAAALRVAKFQLLGLAMWRRATQAERGKAVQVDPIKPTLKAPGTKGLKLEHDELLSSFAFSFNLRCYSAERGWTCFNRNCCCRGVRQGLTLVHFSAQLEPFLTQDTPSP
jgi:hypothetical protein